VPLLESELGLGRDEQGRPQTALGPLVTAGVEVVVDPGDRPLAGEFLDRRQLPVGAAAAGGDVEGKVGHFRQPEDLRQVEVGFVLPAAGPDQLEVLGEPQQPVAYRQRDAVRNPVDQLQLRMRRPLLEPEQRDDAVDVDG